MKKISLLFLIFLIPFFTYADPRNMTVDDIFNVKDISDPNLSPDGKWVAFVVRTLDREKDTSIKEIFMTPFAGGNPIRLAASTSSSPKPRWSPDNKYLAFRSKDEKKKNQIFLLNRQGGEPVQLTNVPQGVWDLSWSPDGKKLALLISDLDPDEIEEEEGKPNTPKPIVVTRLQFKYDQYDYLKELYDHIYIFDIETKEMKQITSGPYNDGGEVWSGSSSTPQWSPDGKQILFVSNRTKNPDSNRNTDIFVVPSDGGEVRRLTDNPGTDEAPRWSPDGKWIVYQASNQPELMWYDTVEIAVISRDGGTPRILTRELDRNGSNPQFSADGKNVYFLLENQGTELLASVPANGGKINTTVTAEKMVLNYNIGLQNQIVFTATRPQMPEEVFRVNGTQTEQLTSLQSEWLKQVTLATMERIHYSSKDGTKIEAFVLFPPGYQSGKKYPTILWIHGGPTLQYGEEFEFRPQILAAQGYVVLRVNPRGSTGYGEEFCKAIWADWGNKDYEDLMAGVDYLIEKGIADQEKLGVGGWSYGGIMTDNVIVKTDRFKAAISGASEFNYFQNYGVDHYQFEWEAELGLPWENFELWKRLSPFFQIQKAVTPTLVMCGQEDWNVPLINSEQLYQSLRRLGVDTMLVVYPGQNHGFTTPSYIKDRYERWIAWFDHYLKGTPDKTPKQES